MGGRRWRQSPEPTMDSPPPESLAPRKRQFSIRNVLLALTPVLLAFAFYLGWYYREQMPSPVLDHPRQLRPLLVAPMKLDPAYTDADKDLVADPPSDKAQLLDPAELVFATLGPDP